MHRHPTEPDPLSTVLGSLVGTFSVAAGGFLAVLGFAGGTVPVLGWHLPGGLLPGLTWLAALGSVGIIVLWFVPLMASIALYAALSGLRPGRVPRQRRPPARLPGRPSRQAA